MKKLMISLLSICVASVYSLEISIKNTKDIGVFLAEEKLVIGVGDVGNDAVWTEDGDRLYIARFCTISSGCRLECTDLKGNRVFIVSLDGLGPIRHSKYRNSVTIELDGENVKISGSESSGKYIEIRTKSDGSLVSNLILP